MRLSKLTTVLLGAIFSLPTILCAQFKEKVKEHTIHLASDALQGRGTGSTCIQLAADYIAAQFGEIGLQKIESNTYFQKFSLPGQTALEKNVIGIIPASQPTKTSIVFTAHYDGFGVVTKVGEQDSIYNGARDNAVGVAALIELARAFKKEITLKHNLVFIATAAEEVGHYGSKYYVNHPIYPIKEIVLCLNIDGFNVSGPREDYFVFPRQGIDFLNLVTGILKQKGWHYLSPDWVDSMNTNFDTASFLEKGIPAITLWTGTRLKNGKMAQPIEFGAIHSPQDEVTHLWNWEGIDDHLLMYKAVADYFLRHSEKIKVAHPEFFYLK